MEIIFLDIQRNIFIVLPVSSSASRRAVQILRRYSIQKGLGLSDALIAAVTISTDGKQEIEGFGVKALDILDVKIKMEGVIVAVAHDEFKKSPFLAQVLSLERKCNRVRLC